MWNSLTSLSVMKAFGKASFLSDFGDNFMTLVFKTEPNELSTPQSARHCGRHRGPRGRGTLALKKLSVA